MIQDENAITEELLDRKTQMENIANMIGMDSADAAKMIADVQEMDRKLMEYLANNDDPDGRRKMLQQNKMQRDSRIRGTMTEEQYRQYRKEIVRQARDTTPPASEKGEMGG